MSEQLATQSELSATIQRFSHELITLAPQVAEGRTAYFEDPNVTSTDFVEHYTCNVVPSTTADQPPTVYLFHGYSAICHQRQGFSYDETTGQYIKRITDFEPTYETAAPQEIDYDPTPATDLELGTVLGILKMLKLKPSSEA